MNEVVLLDLEGGSDLWGELDGLDVGSGAPRTALGMAPMGFLPDFL